MNFLYLYFLFSLTIIKCDYRGMRVRRIVGGIPAEVPPPDDPVVFVKHNGKFARIEGKRNANEYHYQFRGIRYAHAPIGKQRFQRPKQYIAEGNIDATKYPEPCLQPKLGTNKVIGSEDCLFLNVYTPLLPQGTEGLPVVLWIHGGGYRYGSASQYNVQNLVNKKVVLVTIQYRLGTLGFLSTGDLDLPGNAGLFDMALAVQWTRNYIGYFGGNPYQIVVMGQGSGGSSGLLLCLSNIAKGLTKGVVAMSGSAVANGAVDNEPKKFAIDIAERHGCPTNNVLIMISCLRAISAEEIIRVDSIIEDQNLKNHGYISGLTGKLTPYPIIERQHDGRSIPGFIDRLPLKQINDGDAPKIPLLIGVTRDETGNAVNDDVFFNLPAYLTAQKWSKNYNNTFLYRFEHLSNSFKGYHFLKGLPIVGNLSLGNGTENIIGHGDELAFIFSPQNLDGSALNITVNETEEDRKVRNIFTDIIYSFVKYGYILNDNKPVQQFVNAENNYIGISAKLQEKNNFRFCQIGLWTQMLERLESPICKFLSTVNQGVQTAGNVFTGTVDKLSDIKNVKSGINRESISFLG